MIIRPSHAMLYCLAVVVALLDVSNSATAFAQVRPGSPGARLISLRRFGGPVRIGLVSMVIAPGKTDGSPWDGPGMLPWSVVDKARHEVDPVTRMKLTRALSQGIDPRAVLTQLHSWTADAFSASQAPDVQALVFLDGVLVASAAKVPDSHFPGWTSSFTGPVQMSPQSLLQIQVTDVDMAFDDPIGGCTVVGNPYVDDMGFVDVSSVRCDSQIWAIGLRVVPTEAHPAVTYSVPVWR